MSTDVKRFPSSAVVEGGVIRRPTALQLVEVLERLRPLIPGAMSVADAPLLLAQLAAVIFSALGKPPARAFDAAASWANDALSLPPVCVDDALRILSSEGVVETIAGLGAALTTESQPRTLQAIDLLMGAFNAFAADGSNAGGN